MTNPVSDDVLIPRQPVADDAAARPIVTETAPRETPASNGGDNGSGSPPPGTGDKGLYYGGEPGAIADSHWRDLAYWLVLAAAAAVDVANFYTIVAIVMRADQRIVWMVVVGFTVLALALSHRIGEQARSRVDKRYPPRSSGTAWLAFACWLSMGLFAFVVRYRGGGSTFLVGSGGGDILNAGMFMTFYLATGLVAGLAGYHRPNPNIKRVKRFDKMEAQLVNKELTVEDGRLAEVRRTIEAVEDRRSEANVKDRHAAAEDVLNQVKAYARNRILGLAARDVGSAAPSGTTPPGSTERNGDDDSSFS